MHAVRLSLWVHVPSSPFVGGRAGRGTSTASGLAEGSCGACGSQAAEPSIAIADERVRHGKRTHGGQCNGVHDE